MRIILGCSRVLLEFRGNHILHPNEIPQAHLEKPVTICYNVSRMPSKYMTILSYCALCQTGPVRLSGLQAVAVARL